MNLSYYSESKGQTLHFFGFLQPENNDDEKRYDFVSLVLDRINHNLSGRIHIDVGCPVLQPQALKVDIPQNIFRSLNTPEEILKLLELISLGCLSLGTNLPIRMKRNEELTPQNSVSDNDFGFSELMSLEFHEEYLPISQLDVAFGKKYTLLTLTGTHYVLNRSIVISLGDLESVFDSASFLTQAGKLYNISLSPEFYNLNIELAHEALKLVPKPSVHALWFYGDSANPSQKYRIQAAQSYPLLAEYLLKIDEARAAIDTGKQLLPIISEVTGLSKAKLKRLTKLEKPSSDNEQPSQLDDEEFPVAVQRTRRFELANTLRIETIIDALNDVDVGIIPNSYTEWDKFLQITSGCTLALEKQLDISLSELLNSSKGDWKKFHHSLAQSAQIPVEGFHLDHITFAAADALEAIDDFTRTLFLPRILFHFTDNRTPLPLPTTEDLIQANIASFNLLRGNSSNLLGFLFNLGYRWSNRYQHISQILSPVKEEKKSNPVFEEKRRNNSWPKLTDKFVTKNSMLIHNLTSLEELKEESDRLNHCVGNLYVNSAKKGRCHIYSIQNIDGAESYSTFEVSPPNSRNNVFEIKRLTVCQHKGRNNRAANKKSKEALAEWVLAVKQGTLKLNLEEVMDWKDEANQKRDVMKFHQAGLLSPTIAWQRLLGENWDNKNLHGQIWNEWREYILSGKLAKQNSSEFISACPETQCYMTHFSPKISW